MARPVYFSLWPTDVLGFVYNVAGNLHRGPDAAHSVATLHYLLRNNLTEDAKSWYKNWRHHIPQSELSHDQLMLLDDDYRIRQTAKQQLMSMIDANEIGTLLAAVLGKLAACGAAEREPEPERNHRPRTTATVG